MTNPRSILVKANAVVRQLGHTEGEHIREYQDWHIEMRRGTSYVSIWWSGSMVFLALANVPVFHQSGPWEQYLDGLFNRRISDRTDEPA